MKVTAVELARLLGQAHPPTPEQAAVIESPLEPLLVVAGAGSGKTETMAARVVYLVANGLVRPDQILGLTFTRKAAGQLSDRIRTRLGTLGRSAGVDPATREMIQGVEPVVSTYHAFGGRVISEYGPLVGVDSGARVLTPTAAWRLARSVVQRWDGDLDTDLSPDQVTSRVLDVASSLSDHLRTVDELSETLLDVLAQIRDAPPAARQRGDLHSTLATPVRRLTDRLAILPLVRAFSQQKLRDGTIDFGDQMMLAATLARNHPRVGENLRDRFRVVLLDEYQDTGHAQRVLLSQLFGAGSTGRGHPVTAVGDPVQSIYSWRGASASNLPHFVTDFPRRRGGPAARSDLLTSFRNPVSVLAVANRISEPVRAAPVRVATLAPRPGAAAGRVRYGLFHTVEDEDAFIAAEIAGAWKQAAEDGRPAPTTAVLLRRRADMAPVAELLRSHGLPVEVSGLGGLLAEPEIVDLVSALRVLVDPGAGDAAVRLLTGARWNLGLADLAALHRRARLLAVSASAAAPTDSGLASVRSAMAEAGSGEDITSASLVDAIADPGEPGDYSEEGYRRVQALEAELRRLRQRVDHPLPELVADIERTLGLDVEVLLADGPGRAHLDAFADEVAEFAGGAGSTGPADLLDYLQVAVAAEKGLAPGEVQQVEGAVQILTVHAAKGLEWELVAVPHLADKVFPGGKGTTWLTDDEQLPPSLRGDVDDIPGLRLDPGMDQKEIGTAIEAHRSDWSAAGLAEERRLLYVAVTRAEEELIFGSHYFTGSASKARGPSAFFLELAAAASSIAEPSMWVEAPGPEETNPLLTRPRTATWPIDALGARRAQVLAGAAAVGERLSEHRRNGSPDAGVVTDHGDAVGALDDAALDDAALDDSAQDDAALDNAALDDSALDDSAQDDAALDDAALDDSAQDDAALDDSAQDDAALDDSAQDDAALDDSAQDDAALDNTALDGGDQGTADAPDAVPDVAADPFGWRADVAALLAERETARNTRIEVDLPEALSVSSLVTLAEDPDELARRIRRPLPARPAPHARRGTAFHSWLETYYTGDALVDVTDLPGAEDQDADPDADLEQLQAQFQRSAWAMRSPHALEVPFAMRVGSVPIRGRMDAVFADPDGGWTVVDWKTGRPPAAARAGALSVQLAAYRLAWAQLVGAPLESVRAVFHYVSAGQTVAPVDLLDLDGLTALVESATAEPSAAEPVMVEPSAAEPVVVEPSAAEPVVVEPSAAEPMSAEPSAAEPVTAEPSAAEPMGAEPSAAEPVMVEPSAAEPLTAEPATPVSRGTDPG